MAILHQFNTPGLAIASYVVGDDKTGEAAVIDPTRDIDDLISFATKQGLHIKHILETHVHADFVSGACELKNRLNDDAQIYCSGLGGKDWTPTYADHVVKEDDEVVMGDIRLQALHTPGHTPEHVTWLFYDESRSKDKPWAMFKGDFLFVGDVGRPDLLGDDAQQELAHKLYQSVFEKMSDLPDFVEIYPGHGAGSLCGKAIGSRQSSTLGFERQFGAAFNDTPKDKWVENLMADMPLAPPYFKRMKKVNQEGPAIMKSKDKSETRWSAKSVYEQVCEDCLIVDVRAKESFAAAHIPKSINIPLSDNLVTWAGWVLPYDLPTLIVLDDPKDMNWVTTQLGLVGFDQVQGYLEGGIEAWQMQGYPLAGLETISVHKLNMRLNENNEAMTVLDVRTEQEWEAGHIKGACHIHGGKIQDSFSEIPADKPVAVMCGSGYRASIAASFLKRENYEEVSNVLGGMHAWQAADFPIRS